MRREALALVLLLAGSGLAAGQPRPAPTPASEAEIVSARALFADLRVDAGRQITFCRFRRLELRAAMISMGRAQGDARATRARAVELAATIDPDFERAWALGPRGQAARGTVPGDAYWADRERLARGCDRQGRPRAR